MADIQPKYGVNADSGIGALVQAGATIPPAAFYGAGVDAYGNLFVMTEGSKPTFSAVSVALAVVTAATDFFQITAGSKTVRVLRIGISGTAATAVIVPVLLYRRPTATTGGTAATSLALPVAGIHDTSNGASTATLNAWTANPTVTSSGAALIRAGNLATPINTDATTPLGIAWDFTTRNGQGLVLRTGQSACLNLNGAAISTGSLLIDIEWSEE